MKQKLRLFTSLLLLAVASTAWGAEEVYKTALFGSDYNSQGVSSYTATWTATNSGFTVSLVNFNNNNNNWNVVKCGRKNNASVATITTSDAIDKAVSKVAVTIDAITADKVNSIKLYTSADNSTWTEAGTFDKSTGTKEVSLSTPTANWYYKVEFDCASGSSNGLVTVSKVEYYINEGGSAVETVATPTFSPEAGVYTSAPNVTISTDTQGATIYYTTDGTDPTTSSSVYSSPITISSTTTIKAMAVKNGMENSAVATATYAILDHAGTEDDPYTVADARNAIDANTGVTNVYATGIVSEIVTAYSSQYGNISYNISVDGTTTSDQLQAYRGKSFNGDNFTSEDDIQVGDVVVVYGTLKKHNETYEFDANNQLVSLQRAADVEAPVFSPEGGAYKGTQSVTITTTTEGATIYYTTDGSTPTAESTEYTGAISVSTSTTLKAIAVKGAKNSAVTTAHYAILEHEGTEADPYTVADARAAIDANAGVKGVYATGIIAKVDDFTDGAITYWISADGTTEGDMLEAYKGKNLKNQAFNEKDDLQVGDIVTITGDLTKYKTTYEFAAGNYLVSFERPVPPVETPKVHVGTLTNVTIAKMWIGDDNLTDIEDGAEVEAGTEVFVEFTVAEGYTFESFNVVDADGNAVKVTENTGNWSFTMPESNVTITATATENTPAGDKTLTNANIVAAGNGDTSYKEWTITDTNGKDWKAYAIKNQHSKATSAYHYLQIKKYASSTAYYLQVPEYGTKITKIEMTVSGSSKPMDGAGNTATLYFSAENSTSAAGEGVASGTGESTVTIDCSDLNLNTGYITASGAVRIWDVTVTYEEATSETVTVSVNALATDGNKYYSTLYYGDKNLKIPAGITASGVSVNGKSLVMGPVLAKDNVIAKGNAVLLTADAAGNYEFTVVADTEVDATISWDANLLRGNDEEATTEGGDVYYQLSRNANKDANSIGFYWGAADGGAFNNKAHRAYLAVTTEQAGGAKGFAFNDMATGIKSIAADTENGNAIIYNLAGQRVSNAQKGIYIVNGKKVVIR